VPWALAPLSILGFFPAGVSCKLLMVLWRLLFRVPDMATEPVGGNQGLAEKQMNGGGQVEAVAGGKNGWILSCRWACG